MDILSGRSLPAKRTRERKEVHAEKEKIQKIIAPIFRKRKKRRKEFVKCLSKNRYFVEYKNRDFRHKIKARNRKRGR